MATQLDKVVFPTGDYIESGRNNVFYGTCTTAAATSAKVVTCNDFNELTTGVTIHVKFTYQYTGSVTPTLNVNSTGAKSITVGTYTSGNMTLTKHPTWNNGQAVSFTYDGTNWCMNEYFERNTDTKVTQTESTTDAEYEVTFAGSTGTTTSTEGVGKSEYFTFNPSRKAFTFGSRTSGSTVGEYSVAMGSHVIASEMMSYAEGALTTASEFASHAEGCNTTASGDSSHAEGDSTTANHLAQHVFGTYNIADPSTADAAERGNYIEIVGNGTATNARSNARTLDWNGTEWLAGSLIVGASPLSATTVMSAGIGGTDNQTNAGTFLLSVSGGGTGKPRLYLSNQGSNANTVSVTASDITLGGTSNTWDGTNTSLKDAISSKLNRTGDKLQTIANQTDFEADSTNYGIDMQNSSLVNVNAINFNDTCDYNTEGVHFKRTNGNWDTLLGLDGVLKFITNRTNNGNDGTTNNVAFCVGNIKIAAGSDVKSITTATGQTIYTNAQLNTKLGVTNCNNANTVLYIMNGDDAAQSGRDINAVYYNNGNWNVRFRTAPIAGAYRFNYIIVKFA